MNYTSEQQQIIKHDINTHALVSAVAGSGKTQTLIARIEYLLSQKVQPHKILVLMYNKSAQEEFSERLVKVLGKSSALRINVRTMHSLGNSFLQAFKKVNRVNYQNILREYETDSIIQRSLKKAQLEAKLTKEINAERIEEYKNYISLLKSGIALNRVVNKVSAKEKKVLSQVFDLFTQECQQNGYITYDDMIYIPCKLFKEDSQAVAQAKKLYSHIIVDEYQDINEVQQSLLRYLVGDESTVMAVGDVDQTIYQWRGSTPYYMLEGFKKDFAGAQYFELSYTFRYGDLISLMANNIISNNKDRHKSLCITYPKLDKVTNVSILDSSNKVVTQLKSLIEQGVPASEIAVLVRKYNSTTTFELSCLYNDLPYTVVADKNIFREDLFKAIYGYLMLFNKGKGFSAHLDKDKIEFIKSMLNYPSLYLKKDQKEKLAQQIAQKITTSPEIIEILLDTVSESYKKKNISNIAKNWKKILATTKSQNVEDAVEMILETFNLRKVLQQKHTETYRSQSKQKIVDGIVAFAQSRNSSLNQFINTLFELYQKSQNSVSDSDEKDKIQIMSIHRAKGLEWNYVVLYDATEGGFFGEKADKVTKEILEEERRLFYVAITRVKQHLFLVSANDIKRVNAWYKTKSNNHPKDLKCNNSVRFLYEGNLIECEEFIKNINTTKKENKVIFKRYRQKINLEK